MFSYDSHMAAVDHIIHTFHNCGVPVFRAAMVIETSAHLQGWCGLVKIVRAGRAL